MSRQTSVEVYEKIRENGLLSRKRLEAYETLYKHGGEDGLTSGEAFAIMMRENPNRRGPLLESRARFTELRDLGVVVENGTRICKATGNRAICWVLTHKLPSGTVKRFPKLAAEDLGHLRAIYVKGTAPQKAALAKAIGLAQRGRGRR